MVKSPPRALPVVTRLSCCTENAMRLSSQEERTCPGDESVYVYVCLRACARIFPWLQWHWHARLTRHHRPPLFLAPLCCSSRRTNSPWLLPNQPPCGTELSPLSCCTRLLCRCVFVGWALRSFAVGTTMLPGAEHVSRSSFSSTPLKAL